MQLLRTTIRLDHVLKKAAKQKAIEENISFQDLMQRALKNYLIFESKKKAKKIIFKSQAIGAPLDNLTREDIYAD